MSIRHASLFLASLALLAGCGSSTEPAGDIAGIYTALVFRVQNPGQAATDVLAAGGTLTITISSSNDVSGSLNVPASLNGGQPFVASMAGTAVRNGNTVTFDQSADTFVRDLEWLVSPGALVVNGQVVGGTAYTVTLAK